MSDTAIATEVDRLDREQDAIREAFARHEEADTVRHQEVMGVLGELRDGQRRTVAVWLAEVGADPVTIPLLGTLKVRSIVVLVVLAVGSATWLGISGDSVWAVVTHELGLPTSEAASVLPHVPAPVQELEP